MKRIALLTIITLAFADMLRADTFHGWCSHECGGSEGPSGYWVYAYAQAHIHNLDTGQFGASQVHAEVHCTSFPVVTERWEEWLSNGIAYSFVAVTAPGHGDVAYIWAYVDYRGYLVSADSYINWSLSEDCPTIEVGLSA